MKLLKNLKLVNQCSTLESTVFKTLALYEKLTENYNTVGAKLDIELSNNTGAPEKVFKTFRYFRNDLSHFNNELFDISDNLHVTIILENYKYDLKVAIRILKRYLKKKNLKDIDV